MQRDNPIMKKKEILVWKISKKKPPRTVLVKKKNFTNKIVILQDIALEIYSVWVVPVVGHTHSHVTWTKNWFQDWKRSFLGRFKVASLTSSAFSSYFSIYMIILASYPVLDHTMQCCNRKPFWVVKAEPQSCSASDFPYFEADAELGVLHSPNLM